MRYHALAADFDGTIAHHGKVDQPTLEALQKLKKSGRRLILVTGRELPDLEKTFPEYAVFDRIVAENGALLYSPETKKERLLAEPPPAGFADELRRRGVGPISVGRSIVATWEPHDAVVLQTIRDAGLELQVIFNKGAVMVLPSGVNKASGLLAQLKEIGLSPHNVVAVGDAENDHAFLSLCECAVAVSNALPALKDRADIVTAGDHGRGVIELIDHLLKDDLKIATPKLRRHQVLIGHRQVEGADPATTQECFEPYGQSIMICGTSGSGKSTLTTGLLERIMECGYQFAIIDPEGDYEDLEFAVELGTAQRAPDGHEVTELAGEARKNAAVNLLGLPVEHRPAFFNDLISRLLELRSRTGRPHWVVVDEAHHLLPTAWKPTAQTMPPDVKGMIYITVHPESVAPAVRESIDILIAIGQEPHKTVAAFCKATGEKCPKVPEIKELTRGDAVLWRRGDAKAIIVRTPKPTGERKRHSRKYAEGTLDPSRSFYFRGPRGKLNLRAHNLFIFLQMADGIDNETWEYHRKRNDYSRWMGADGVKDDELAADVERIEKDKRINPRESRVQIRKAVEARYTLPSDKPSGTI